nr:gamma subclass chorismate mutase AroQ [Ruegeria lacuscaerulensis]
MLLVTSAQPRADTDALFNSINDRLSWMKGVAAWKYRNEVDVEDLAREAVVLKAAVEASQQAGLAGPSVQMFFRAQIEAAKAIQRCWLSQWQSGDTQVPNPLDLVADIRPELLRLGQTILTELGNEISENGKIDDVDHADFDVALSVPCLSDSAKSEIFDGLKQVTLAQ